MMDIEQLKFYIEGTHNVKCEIINEKTIDDKITILVDNLTSELQVGIEESIIDFMGEDTFTMPIVWDRQTYIDTNATIILTKDDIAVNCRDVPFDEVTLQMFPRTTMDKIVRAKKILYRIYTGNEDIPYITKNLKDRNVYSVHNFRPQTRVLRTPEEEARIRALFNN